MSPRETRPPLDDGRAADQLAHRRGAGRDRRPARHQGRVLVQGRRLPARRRLGGALRAWRSRRPTVPATRRRCGASARPSPSASPSWPRPDGWPTTRPCARRCHPRCWSCWPSPASVRAPPARSGGRWASPRCPELEAAARAGRAAQRPRHQRQDRGAHRRGHRRAGATTAAAHAAWARRTPSRTRVGGAHRGAARRRLGHRWRARCGAGVRPSATSTCSSRPSDPRRSRGPAPSSPPIERVEAGVRRRAATAPRCSCSMGRSSTSWPCRRGAGGSYLVHFTGSADAQRGPAPPRPRAGLVALGARPASRSTTTPRRP